MVQLETPKQASSIQYSIHLTAKNYNTRFPSQFRAAPNAISYTVSHELADLFLDKYILYSVGGHFDFDVFFYGGLCASQSRPGVLEHIVTYWKSASGVRKYEIQHGWYDVVWESHSFGVVLLTWISDGCTNRYYWIVGASQTLTETLGDVVCAWSTEVRGEVWGFEDGDWERDIELYSAIKNATFDNLVLFGRLKQDIQHNFQQFLDSRAVYERYKLPWTCLCRRCFADRGTDPGIVLRLPAGIVSCCYDALDICAGATMYGCRAA